MMKTFATALAVLALPFAAMAEDQGPTISVPFDVQQANVQMRLNNLACKATGLDDNMVTCKAAEFFNGRMLDLLRAESEKKSKAVPKPPEPPTTAPKPAK